MSIQVVNYTKGYFFDFKAIYTLLCNRLILSNEMPKD